MPSPNQAIHVYVTTNPIGCELYWRIVSTSPDVRSSNRLFLGYTPYRKTANLRIPGLSKENARDVTIVIEIEKPSYLSKIRRLNAASILSDMKISEKIRLVRKK